MRSFRIAKVLRISTLAVALCLVLQASLTSGQQKMNLIERGRWPANGAIAFTPPELLALGMSQINAAAPGAVLKPTLRLERNGATGTALIDFDKLKDLNRSNRSNGNWLFSRLVSGQQPVTVTVQVTSSHGHMTVHPTAVSVSGYAISGGALDFLVQNFLVAQYPDAIIDKPFDLPPNVSRIEVNTKSALVYRR